MKILLFEDYPNLYRAAEKAWKAAGHSVELATHLPPTPEDPSFQALVARALEFDMIVWDNEIMGTDDKNHKSVDGFIQAFSSVFGKRPMIAYSNAENNRQAQVSAGCTHQVSEKSPAEVLRIIAQLRP